MNPKQNPINSYDLLGNIAIMKFPRRFRKKEKKKAAEKLLKQNSIRTVLEKTRKFSGKLRKPKTKYLAGEKTKEAKYKENNCVFRFNVDKTYFSPRLSNERKEIAKKIKKDEEVLVMFSGVGPYPIVIAKNSKAKSIDSIEINKQANKYAILNRELNKIKGIMNYPYQGDIKRNLDWERFEPTKFKTKYGKKVPLRGRWIKQKYDVIVMPRPQLKDSFLREAFILSKKGTRIYYYDFCKEDELESIKEKIKCEAKKAGKKIKITNTKKAGEIGPYKYRIRVDFKVI